LEIRLWLTGALDAGEDRNGGAPNIAAAAVSQPHPHLKQRNGPTFCGRSRLALGDARTWTIMDAKPIAAILGPTLVAVTVSELLNFRIWSSVAAPVVYLNGALLFVGGLVFVRSHNVWRLGWPLLITLSG